MPKTMSKRDREMKVLEDYFLKKDGLTLNQINIRNLTEFYQENLLDYKPGGWEHLPQFLRQFLRENGYLRSLSGAIGGRRLDVERLAEDIPSIISGDYWRE